MSVMPGRAPDQEPKGSPKANAGMPGTAEAPIPPPVVRKRGWQHRLLMVCFAIFALEIGLFLVIFPWMDSWNLNYFKILSPAFQTLWSDPYFRGGLSGLGLVNIYVAVREVAHLVRGY